MTTIDTNTAPVSRRGALAVGGLSIAGLFGAFAAAAPAADAAVSVRVNRAAVVSTARRGIGVRYRSGGESTRGWDCSGFTRWVYQKHGVSLPHSASAQKRMGRVISKRSAVPGDLLIWPGHVGIYAGGNQVIDAGNHRVNTSKRKIWGRPQYVRIGR